MPIRFNCQSCGIKIRVPDGSAGKKVRCPKCGAGQRVPAQSETEPREAPAPPAPEDTTQAQAPRPPAAAEPAPPQPKPKPLPRTAGAVPGEREENIGVPEEDALAALARAGASTPAPPEAETLVPSPRKPTYRPPVPQPTGGKAPAAPPQAPAATEPVAREPEPEPQPDLTPQTAAPATEAAPQEATQEEQDPLANLAAQAQRGVEGETAALPAFPPEGAMEEAEEQDPALRREAEPTPEPTRAFEAAAESPEAPEPSEAPEVPEPEPQPPPVLPREKGPAPGPAPARRTAPIAMSSSRAAARAAPPAAAEAGPTPAAPATPPVTAGQRRYLPLLIAAWTLRCLAVVMIGVAVTHMLRRRGQGVNLPEQLPELLRSLLIAGVAWAVGEIAATVRDIARHGPR